MSVGSRVVIVIRKRVLMTVLGVLALSLTVGVKPSCALEDFRVYRGVLVLEGKIVPGDAAKLRNFLADKATFEKITGGVFLASPGGNLAEAVKLGLLIRALRLSTDAPSGPPLGGRKFGESLITPSDLRHPAENYVCASACFLVFVSGIYRNLYWAGRLGIHRPFRDQANTGEPMNEEVYNANLRKLVEVYLRQMNVRIKYVDLMFSVPSNEVRWITQNELDSDLRGLIPDLKDMVAAKCAGSGTVGAAGKDKGFASSGKQVGDVAACRVQAEAQLRAEQPLEAWSKVFGAK